MKDENKMKQLQSFPGSSSDIIEIESSQSESEFELVCEPGRSLESHVSYVPLRVLSPGERDESDGENSPLRLRGKRGRPSSSRSGSSSGTKNTQTRHVSSRRKVTKAERENARTKAALFKADNEVGFNMAAITMLRTHVYTGFHLTIPKPWAQTNLFSQNHQVLLQVTAPDGVPSTVGCRWTETQQCQFIAGWRKFVLKNNLEEDDVLVFKLVCKGESPTMATLQVNIFRVVDEIKSLKVVRS